jgi:DNA-binding transcriptional regulator/RsmH inhibitor MraZ
VKKPERIIDPTDRYKSKWLHVVDGSNRVMLPALWKRPGYPKEFDIYRTENYLVAFPPGLFKSFREGACQGVADRQERVELERLLNEAVNEVVLDPVSRLPLPREFTNKVGIDKQVVLIGRSSIFEIWSPEKYEQSNPAREAAKLTAAKLIP